MLQNAQEKYIFYIIKNYSKLASKSWKNTISHSEIVTECYKKIYSKIAKTIFRLKLEWIGVTFLYHIKDVKQHKIIWRVFLYSESSAR